MEFNCKEVSVTDSEIGVEIYFQELTHIDDLIGHFRPKIKLSKTKCEFEYDKKQVTINHQISKKKFEEIKEVINALGIVEIKN